MSRFRVKKIAFLIECPESEIEKNLYNNDTLIRFFMVQLFWKQQQFKNESILNFTFN